MGSMDSSYGYSRKREIDECIKINDLDGDVWGSFSKRTCTGILTPEEQADDLCLLGTFPREENILQSDAQEDLISEMMKSLENAISTTEESESCWSQGNDNNPTPAFHTSCSGKVPWQQQQTEFAPEISTSDSSASSSRGLSKDKPRSSDPSESEIDIKYLFEASDDELGIPASPHSNAGKIFNLAQDIFCSDHASCCSEPFDRPSVPIIREAADEANWRASGEAAAAAAAAVAAEWPLEKFLWDM